MLLLYTAKNSKHSLSFMTKESQRKWLKGSIVMHLRQGCTKRHALQLNPVPSIENTLTPEHQLGQNRNLNNVDLEN